MITLDLPLQLSPRWPLLPVRFAGPALDLTLEEVTHACESGQLAWAFDLAVPGARRREIRIWRGSIHRWIATGGRDAGAGADIPLDQILADILPGKHDPLTSEIKRRWMVSRDLIADLITAGAIRVSRPAAAKQGIHAASRISRSSATQFLKTRRIS